MNTQFTWIPFIKEFAQKLLPYRNNIQPLIDFIYTLKDNKGKPVTSYIKDNNGGRVPNIDPFSVVAIFCRRTLWNTRKKICSDFKQFLSIQSDVPTDFEGVPVLNPMRSFYFNWDDFSRIDPLWNLFEKIVSGHPFVKEMDKVLQQGLPIGMLTMAFYWIDAYSYLALDGTNRAYLQKYGFNADKVKSAKDYFALLDQIREAMRNGSIPYSSIPEFSRDAFEKRDSAPEESEDKPTLKKKVVDTPRGQQYWWLTGSPKYWSPSLDWELGNNIDYTLYNDKGNKRHIFKHFYEAKPGDVVIAYESTPVLQIVAIGQVVTEVVSETEGDVIYIKKMEELSSPIPYSEIQTNPILKKSEPVMNRCQGSIFHLEQEEYEEVMRLIRRDNPTPTVDIKDENSPVYPPYSDQDFLQQVFMSADELKTLKSLLLRKKNLIFQGAPGVGKTFAAKRLAYAIMGEQDNSRVKQIQFHQNYSYEDFMMGYKPDPEGGFKLTRGIFYDFCKHAEMDSEKPYFLIIDEINRGNMSKIFGELLQLIETDYRNEYIQLPYNKEQFAVPSNLYIIGMMNTADRSLAMIDYALRRRFCFYKMQPAFRSQGFRSFQAQLNSPLLNKVIEQVKKLNEVIKSDASLGEGFEIGHSYFCGLKAGNDLASRINEIVRYDIIPMLEEYWFDDPKTLKEQADRLLEALK